ncbi:hypothetical protein SAMN05444858_10377 [Micromonospora avicenniae]|uniref:Uncharacterized protein n=1 Tax=Micromonospora avicenniae TaxID=1198245 RepID=A0A1N6TRV3_9ACTN|nr:hypothetical protein SAMN05444858_10377 [Micromonospora avicenniae]
MLIDLKGRELARQSLPQALDNLTLTAGPV